MKNNGILRLLTVFLSCFLIAFFNVKEVIEVDKKEIILPSTEEEIFNFWEETEEKEEEEQINEEDKKEQNTSYQPQNNAVETSTSAVKGKILTQYISPYNASLSYDGVYLKNNSSLEINLKNLLEAKLSFKIKNTQEPQVLILHTHATETFMEKDAEFYTEKFNSRTTDNNKNMIKIGSIVSQKLNEVGIKTLHDTTLHDNPQYSGSYSRSAKTINSYLKKYPSIKIILDLHRDSVSSGESDKVKLVSEINSKKAAQVMIVMGSQSGTVKNYPDWQENLKLAVKLQQTIEKKYPTLARPLLLMSKSYNQGLSKGSMLIEFGTDVNTLEEACYSAELVGNALVELLITLKE